MVTIANISAQRIFDLRNTHKSLIVSTLLPPRFCRAGFLQPTLYGTRWHRPARAALLREIYYSLIKPYAYEKVNTPSYVFSQKCDNLSSFAVATLKNPAKKH